MSIEWDCGSGALLILFDAFRLLQQIEEIKSGTRREAVCMHGGIMQKDEQRALVKRMIQACGAPGSKVHTLDLTVIPLTPVMLWSFLAVRARGSKLGTLDVTIDSTVIPSNEARRAVPLLYRALCQTLVCLATGDPLE